MGSLQREPGWWVWGAFNNFRIDVRSLALKGAEAKPQLE